MYKEARLMNKITDEEINEFLSKQFSFLESIYEAENTFE